MSLIASMLGSKTYPLDEKNEFVEGSAAMAVVTLSHTPAERRLYAAMLNAAESHDDAQHIAAELIGRYENERRSFPAISLTTDTSALTALSNDYGYEEVFARQVQGLAVAGDCLIAISTSGKSPNVSKAVEKALAMGCSVIGLTGCSGEPLASHCDIAIVVPSDRTSRVQEAHITIGHLWCEMVDGLLS